MKKSGVITILACLLIAGAVSYVLISKDTEAKIEKVSVTLETDIANTGVIVDGEKQKQLVSDQLNFGELPVGTTIQGEAYFYWGETISEAVSVQAGKEMYDITPEIPVLADHRKALISDIIRTFAKERLLILVTKDPDVLTNVSDQLKNTYIEKLENNSLVDAESLEVQIDFEQMIYEPGPDYQDKLVVPVTFVNQILTEKGAEPSEVKNVVKLTMLYEQAYKYWEVIGEEEL
jgi:hypothetical protein